MIPKVDSTLRSPPPDSSSSSSSGFEASEGHSSSVSSDDETSSTIGNFNTILYPSPTPPSISSVSPDADRSAEMSSYVFLGDDGKLYEISYRVQTPSGLTRNCIATREIWERHAEQLKNHHRNYSDLLIPGCDKDIKLEKDAAKNEFYLSGTKQKVSPEFKDSYFAIPTYKGGLTEALAPVSDQNDSSTDLSEDETTIGTLESTPSKRDLKNTIPGNPILGQTTVGHGTATKGDTPETITNPRILIPPIPTTPPGKTKDDTDLGTADFSPSSLKFKKKKEISEDETDPPESDPPFDDDRLEPSSDTASFSSSSSTEDDGSDLEDRDLP